ncbi:MAG TPA: GAF domain-containing protein [Candidatus Binatia bacterium]|nr:GAF domain-containing protein [Candidatus Binatia bacterium]
MECVATESVATDGIDVPLTSEADGEFPFRTELSLGGLIAAWERSAQSDDPVRAALARVMGEALEKAPELREPIVDPAVIERHRPLVRALMSLAFPPASWEQDFASALVPFRLQSFYATPQFERLFLTAAGLVRGRVKVGSYIDARAGLTLRALSTYAHILRKFYDISMNVDAPMIFTVRDPEMGFDRHFKVAFDGQFVSAEPVGKLPELSEDGRRRLLANLSDPWLMRELLPPELFVFRGFAVLKATEVTDQEILSSLKRDLIDRESVVAPASFRRIQDRLRALFHRPALEFSLAAIEGDQVLMLSSTNGCEHGCIFADSKHYRLRDFDNSIYERAAAEGRPMFLADLSRQPGLGSIEQKILRAGFGSLVVAPLYYQEALIGMLELRSPRAGDLTPLHSMKLQEVLPLLSMAVKRGLDELNGRVQAFIKEQFTAIHPTVEWRFRRAVLTAFEKQQPEGGSIQLEPIVFEGVNPLYAMTDIRGSSTQRSQAIRADLTTHLRLALDVLRAAYQAKDMPILDGLAYQIGQQVARITDGLRSGDELGVLRFIRERIEPVFPQIQRVGGDVRPRLEAYRAAMDPRLATVYRQRKDFDESIALINDTLSAYLDGEEARAQAMFPHYFEKQATDGVEWGMYVGGSLLESGAFDSLHLRNLRLWQLMVLCGMARRAETLKSQMPVPLETTQLVLAHHAPLAIRFRLDEKRFDVDGAYNVRYEVIKKRIDKALVKGTGERVTQPGTIAVVHSQPEEAAEYREFFEYLQARGDLRPGVEELDLEPLQGAEGLRALRVAVEVDPDRGPDDGAARIDTAVGNPARRD